MTRVMRSTPGSEPTVLSSLMACFARGGLVSLAAPAARGTDEPASAFAPARGLRERYHSGRSFGMKAALGPITRLALPLAATTR